MEHKWSDSSLHSAVVRGVTAELQVALQQSHDLEERSRSMTPLQYAAHRSNYDMLPILIDAGAKINAPASALGCAIQATISSNEHRDMPDAVCKDDSDHIQSKKAAQLDAVNLLLSRGADPNAEGGEYGSPLAAASAYGRTEIVRLLLDHGANPSSRGGRMGSALQAACAHGGLPVEWAISFAEHEDYTAVQELLLNAGADVDAVGGLYGTALQAAAAVGDEQAIALLLSRDASPNIHAGKHGCPLRAASDKGHDAIANQLIEHGARYNSAGLALAHQNDDWSIWRAEPVSSLWLRFGFPLPSITND